MAAWGAGPPSCLHDREPVVRYTRRIACAQWVTRGVGYIRLVDFDYVTLSSLNRHATAGLVDVGTPKVQSIARAVRGFARWVEVDPRIDIWRKEEGGALLEGMDWVVGMSTLARPQVRISPTSAADLNALRRRDRQHHHEG